MQVDVIFPVLHGQNGEDGTVQGLARLMHTPVVGCGIDGSVVRMDKILTKQLLENAAIPTVPYVVYIEGDIRPTYKALKQQLGGTLFVKPSRLGSSIGVSKVDSEHGFDEALDTHVSKTVGSVGTAL
jgi:D-alanine-D-alanine ligase